MTTTILGLQSLFFSLSFYLSSTDVWVYNFTFSICNFNLGLSSKILQSLSLSLSLFNFLPFALASSNFGF